MAKKNKENTEFDDLKKTAYAKENSNEPTSSGGGITQFFVGLVLLVAGLFMFSNQVVVHSGWGMLRIGTFNIASGVVTIPLIIGVVWQFFNPKSIFPKIIMVLGGVIIIAAVIMSVRIDFRPTSFFVYIIMFAMIAAGAGLIMRVLFKKDK